MATRRKGFGNERHGTLKLGFTALALAGFAAGWAGFARSHEPAQPLPLAEVTVQPASTPLPASPTRTPTPTPSPGTPVASQPAPTATAIDPEPPATRAPKRSRGS